MEHTPSGTQELAVEMPGPDAPGGTFTHWLIYRMPPGITSLAAIPPGAAEGINDFGRRGYGGPCPPRGAAHHYHFVVLALDTRLGLAAGARRPDLDSRISGHVPGRANWSPPVNDAPERVYASASEPDPASRSEVPALAQTLITMCSQPADGKLV